MNAIAASLVLPLRQLGDPAFISPLLKGLLGAVLAFGGLVALSGWGIGALAGGTGWLATVAALLGGLLALAAAVWLFIPVVLAIAGIFSDEVAAAVEARFYPALPPAAGASLAAQAGANLGLAFKVLLLSVLVLPVALMLPHIGAVVFWIIAAVSLGNGFFEGVAQRRMSVADSRALRRRRRLPVLMLGGVLAALALVPGVNLLIPVLGTAAMTHLLHRG